MPRILILLLTALIYGTFVPYAVSSVPPLGKNSSGTSVTDAFETNPSSKTAPYPQLIKVSGKVYEKPDTTSRPVIEVEKGTEIVLIHHDGEWNIVKLPDNRLGWVHQSLFEEPLSEPVSDISQPSQKEVPEPENNKTLTVKVSRGRVREKPSFNAPIDFGLDQHETVTVLETQNDWHLIQRKDGKSGWAHESLFYPMKPSAEPVDITSESSGTAELKDIRFETTADGEEKVVFMLNGFYPPESSAYEDKDGTPKVICDFKDARIAENMKKLIRVNGKLVKAVRIGIHGETKIRVVMDLIPKKDYEVEQVFYRKDNIYVLTFKPIMKP